MRLVKLALVAAGLVTAAACGSKGGPSGPPNPPPTAITINLDGSGVGVFSPAVDTLALGGTVTWQWDASTHDVTSYGAPGFPSLASHTGSQAPQTIFPVAGTYKFVCTNHGTSDGTTCSGMCGRVVVK